jgi:outer membrane protein assembly factor BamC
MQNYSNPQMGARMKRTAPAAILLAAGIMTGCSTSEPLSQKASFESVVPAVKSKDTLEVPPDLTAPEIQNKYTVPLGGTASAKQMASNQTSAPVNAGTQDAQTGPVVANVDQVHMVREGTQRWLVVDNKTPAELWPLLKAFWQDSGFTIKTEEPDIGVMETDWAENRAKLPNDGIRKLMESIGLGGVYSTSQRDRFRIRLEKGDNGSTEVYFSNQGIDEVFVDEGKSQTKWQPRPPDPELEAEMLGRFMMRLGLNAEQAKTAIKQSTAPVQQQTSPISNGTLTINDSFDRAWRRVGLALDRIGLVVTDRDRSQGIYYVKQAKNDIDPNATETKSDSGGFWSSLAFWRSKDKPEQQLAPDETMRVVVKESTPGSTAITLTDKSGQVVTNTAAKTALSKLQTELQ